MKIQKKINRLFLKAKSYKLKASSRGFTIIETLVAIAILLLSIVGPLTIAEKGLASAEAARQEITAFYLAQEAIEYVRNIRDTAALSGSGGKSNWLNDLNDCKKTAGCGIDVTDSPQSKQTEECKSSNDDCLLYQYVGTTGDPVPTTDPLYGIFGHRSTGGWKDTEFTRKVYITEIVDGVEASTTVRVMWNTPSFGSRYIDLTEHMLNWYDTD